MSKPRYPWWGYVKAIIRQYNGGKFTPATASQIAEYQAVREAVEQTEAMNGGKERIWLVRIVFWERTHTLEGAALEVHCSERTARGGPSSFCRTGNMPRTFYGRAYGMIALVEAGSNPARGG